MTGPSASASAFQPAEDARYKLIYLARRHPALSADAFPAAWRAHSQLASSFATSLGSHFLGVHQCVKDPAGEIDRAFGNDYDGSSILAMKSWGNLMAARYHPHALDELQKDERRVFAGAVDDWTMAVQEEVVVDGETQQHVLLSFLAPVAALDSGEFAPRSRERALALTATGASRIVWNRVVDPARAYPFAAVTELWYADRDTMVADANNPAIIASLEQRGIADAGLSVHLFARLNLAKTTRGDDDAISWSEAG